MMTNRQSFPQEVYETIIGYFHKDKAALAVLWTGCVERGFRLADITFFAKLTSTVAMLRLGFLTISSTGKSIAPCIYKVNVSPACEYDATPDALKHYAY